MPHSDLSIYKPSYIPDGFKLTTESYDGIIYLEYIKDSDYVLYEQNNLNNVSLRINTEDVVLEDTEFKGMPAKYYSNQGVQNLIWYDDYYMYSISSTLSRDEVYKIAESVKQE